MKKRIALLFVVALFMAQAKADDILLAPGQSKTIHLNEAYASSQHDSKAVAYTSGRGSRDVTIHAKRSGNTHIALYAKDGHKIRDLDVTVGSKLAMAEKTVRTENMAAETTQPADAAATAPAVPAVPAVAEPTPSPAIPAPVAAQPAPEQAPSIPAPATGPADAAVPAAPQAAPAMMAPSAPEMPVAQPAAENPSPIVEEPAPAPAPVKKKATKHKAKKHKKAAHPKAKALNAVKKSPVSEEHASAQPSYDSWRTLRNLFPKEPITMQNVGNGVALGGTVSDAATAAQIVDVAKQLSGGKSVINLMQVKSGQQVMLRVRIGEVQRGALDQLGLSAQGVVGAVTGLFYSSKMYDISPRLDYLSQNGLMKVLAEPNLTAISGEKATFLAGGEFPIPVPQKDGVMTVDYKKFGVGIEFTPTVLSSNRIRLAVEPEVSELTKSSVKFAGGKMPTLNTRRAKTTVELAPGESFMIAGLVSDNMRDVSDEMPVLGDIPVLGALFRSTAFKRNETELVIAVTPYLVDPVQGKDIKLPTDKLKPASVMEQYFFGAIAHKPNVLGDDNQNNTAPQQPEGTHGFMTE